MRVCVDTSVFIDVLKDESNGYQDKLYLALARNEKLIAPVIVYGELMPQFKGNTQLLEEFLSDHRVEIEPLNISAVSEAARRWMKYLGRKKKLKCPQSSHSLELKAHFLSDFFIGGFAASRCDAILTRNRGIFKAYFPDLAGYENCLMEDID